MNNISTSYLLWMLGFFGFAGVHRFYNRKIFTGLLWLCTFGLFGIGQLIDLFIIPGMVHEHNARLMFLRMFQLSQRNQLNHREIVPDHIVMGATHKDPSNLTEPVNTSVVQS